MAATTLRIPPVLEPDPETAALLEKLLHTPDGQPLNIFRTLAHHPKLLKRFVAYAGVFSLFGTLSARQRELVVLRTAWRCRSIYEWGQHVLIGWEEGITPVEVARLTQPVASAPWPDDEAVLLTMVDELFESVDVSDETWQCARVHFDEEQLAELLMLAGMYRGVAGFLNAARVQPEEHLPGWPSATTGE